MTSYKPIDFVHKFSLFSEQWHPKVIAEMNDYQFKIVKLQGDFIWHDHKDTDETFIVIEGNLRIDFRDGAVNVSRGEMFVVPKGVEHKPYAENEVNLLLIEPRGVVNTGEEGGERTAEGDVWILMPRANHPKDKDVGESIDGGGAKKMDVRRSAMSKTRRLRELIAGGEFLYMPSAATPLEGRLAEAMGTPLVYTGGYVSGASRAISEPLLTMDEQVRIAGEVARAVGVPLIADAGAGFGEPLHTMRTVREFAAAGVAGIHIEDQLYPKRAHYHAYQVHAIPLPDFVAKIKYACLQRDETDPDFVIIARSDTCREFGLDEAIGRINAAADVGADLGLVFPRNREEAEAAPRRASVPLIWVQSRGNRDGRPILPLGDLKGMGYLGCIDAQILIGAALHGMKRALSEIIETGSYGGLNDGEFVALRKEIEDLIGLDAYYRIETETVEPASQPG